MQIIQSKNDLETFHKTVKQKNQSVGLTPTMGALHSGHMQLLNRSNKECDISVVSIFVNPMQFNNKEDLEKYPKTLEEDISLLKKHNCDYLFLPDENFIYPADFQKLDLDISHLDGEMEGEFRPGHFVGVVNVVYRLFELIKPNQSFFGEKDYQQLAVIDYMAKQMKLDLTVVGCETAREPNGLAMSSRNLRLNASQKEEASIIYDTLIEGRRLAKNNNPINTKKEMELFFQQSNLQLEYIEIVDPNSLKKLQNEWVPKARACVAAFCENVRLIDNMEINH